MTDELGDEAARIRSAIVAALKAEIAQLEAENAEIRRAVGLPEPRVPTCENLHRVSPRR